MNKLIIQGGTPLKGAVSLRGAKNSSYKLMIASLLNSSQIKLSNLSLIADVSLVKDMLQSLGVKIKSESKHSLSLKAEAINRSTISKKQGSLSRASSMFLAPLLARTGKAIVPLPGGDKIGKRPLGWHFDGLKAMGANITVKNGMLTAATKGLRGADYTFPKNSHTGTETLIMAAALARGTSFIRNAALEPEVDDLIQFLTKLGADIKRLPKRIIKINGVKKLKKANYEIMPDRNEAVSYAIAALVTKGDIFIKSAQKDHLTAFLTAITKAGGQYEINDQGIRFFYQNPLKAVNITTKPHPGFMTDWQPLWSVLATQSQGESVVIESIMSNRFQYTKDLNKMGARIKLFNPKPKNPENFYNFNLKDDDPKNQHGIKITGPTPLNGGSFKITDIRAGATLALAGLAAKGQTTLTNLVHLDRGYEDFAGRLLKLGAKIERKE